MFPVDFRFCCPLISLTDVPNQEKTIAHDYRTVAKLARQLLKGSVDVAPEELAVVAESVARLVLCATPAISDAVAETRRLLRREAQGAGTATYDRT